CDPPWHLGLVCRSWRQSALSFTPLWSSLAIPSTIEYPALRSMIEAQLIRTANAPLDVRWTNVQTTVDPDVLDLVLPHCARWRSLSLDVDPIYDRRQLGWLRRVAGSLDQLEKLEAINALNTVIPDVFSTARNLRQVLLTNEDFFYSPTSIVIPWAQITCYRGTYSSERQLEILKAAPNLLECALGFKDYNAYELHHPPSITLLNVRRFCVEEDDFLHHITAPLLKELTVVWFRSSAILLSLVRRSFCTLRKLVLMSCSSTRSSEVVTVLQNLPSITYLLLTSDVDDPWEDLEQDTLFSAMCISGTPADICPNLAEFGFGYVDEFSWDCFFAMAQSRLQPSPNLACRLTCIRIFEAGGGDALPPALVARVNALHNERWDIALLDSEETMRLKGSVCTELVYSFGGT
ncbi:hypothetical protein K438DRAFT_1814302, partial [Mycena galopus ATCC 62051]